MMGVLRWILAMLDRLVERPILGLPLRMIFTCRWHRIHPGIVTVGAGIAVASRLLDWPTGWWLGLLLAGFSAACILLCLVLAPTLALLEWVSRFNCQEPSRSAGGEVLTFQMPTDVLIRTLQQPKHFRILTRSDGSFVARCNSCDVSLNTAEQDGLLWYVCPSCQRSSFQPLGNFRRDVGLASQFGGVFECELFFFSELPPGLEPPSECR